MKLFGPDLLVFETREMSFGYRLLSDLLKVFQAHVIEGSPMPPARFFGLLNGQSQELQIGLLYLESQVPEERMHEYRLIPNIHSNLLKGMYSLLKTQMSESLLIIEMNSLCQNLFVSNKLLNETSLELIELKTSRSSGEKTISFFTGTEVAVNLAAKWVEKGTEQFVAPFQFEVIHKPTEEFKKFFILESPVSC